MSASVETLCVAPDRVDAMWPHVSEWLKAAAERCGDWTLTAIRDCLFNKECLLWVLWDGQRLRAACVTEVVILPRGKVCRVVACGGENASSWNGAFAPIEKYAKELGCVSMRIEGRKGWQRVFPDYGLEWICLEKGLK